MESAGCLLLGVMLGWCLGRRRLTHSTSLVFPTVREPPLIIEVERPRVRPRRRKPDPHDTAEINAEDTVELLRESISRGVS